MINPSSRDNRVLKIAKSMQQGLSQLLSLEQYACPFSGINHDHKTPTLHSPHLSPPAQTAMLMNEDAFSLRAKRLRQPKFMGASHKKP